MGKYTRGKMENQVRLKKWVSIFFKDGQTGNTKDTRIRGDA